ncbi:MAG: CBS domain-containing protein, partial [Bacteroidales bacterium]|nr:CBS domain-containing protein [Bacteroidales bacterium]
MLAKDLISDVIPALRTSDTGQKALYWMDIFRISHLPIVNNEDFLGLISDKDIYDLNMSEEPIGNHNLSLFTAHAKQDQHIYEVMGLLAKLKLSVI